MSNAPSSLSPRQRMINMMYLVLTALLALNVSKEVLNAFQSVNFGLATTNESTISNNYQVYNDFAKAAETFPIKAGPWKDKAFKVKSKVDELELLLAEIKYELVRLVDGKVYLQGVVGELDKHGNPKPIEKTPFYNLDNKYKFLKISYKKDGKDRVLENDKNRDASWDLLSDDAKASNVLKNLLGKISKKAPPTANLGPELENLINEYRNLVLELVDDEILSSNIYKTLSTEINNSMVEKTFLEKLISGELFTGASTETWLSTNFKDMPSIAAYTILTKIETDILSVEADVIKFLRSKIYEDDIKITGGEAMVKAKRSYVFSGDYFEADVFFGATDNTKDPVIYVADGEKSYKKNDDGTYSMIGTPGVDYDSLKIEGGRGKYKIETGRSGEFYWSGILKIVTEGGAKYYPFDGQYSVVKKSAVVSPTSMQIFYILATKKDVQAGKLEEYNGNPIEVSVPGYNTSEVSITCYECEYSKTEKDKKTGNRKCKQTKKKVKYKKKGKGRYLVYPLNRRNGVIIKVSAKRDGKSSSVGSKVFQVRAVPAPIIKLSQSKKQKIKRNNALSESCRLSASLGNGFVMNNAKVKYKITGYEFMTLGTIKRATCRGSRLTSGGDSDSQKKVYKIIKNMKAGEQFIIQNIQYIGPDGQEKPLTGVGQIYTITN